MNTGLSKTTARVHYFFYPRQSAQLRLYALTYFALLICIGTVVGKTYLGFEQSWAQIVAAVSSALATQFLLESVDAVADERPPRYAGSLSNLAAVMLPAWITGFSVAILIYPGGLVWPMILVAVVSISSKFIIRAPLGGSRLHFFNPSNFGIATILMVLPWVGIAPPYHFTENVAQIGNWLVPAVVLGSGIALHALVTKRLPLCLAWFGGFLAQAFLRAWVFNLSLLPLLVPISGVAFILFTLYMIPDPATTPLALKRQVIFGLTVATAYGSLQCLHVVYGLFFSLVLVCGLRGILICLIGCQARIRRAGPVAAPHPIYVARQ